MKNEFIKPLSNYMDLVACILDDVEYVDHNRVCIYESMNFHLYHNSVRILFSPNLSKCLFPTHARLTECD